MTLGGILILAVMGYALRSWWKDRHEIARVLKENPRPHHGDRLIYTEKVTTRASVLASPKPAAPRRRAALALDSDDYSELDSMFGDGSKPEDYEV